MAHNDMYVVMYKIIAYLYDCMKKGVEPDDLKWSSDALGIPRSYWLAVVEELVDHGYIDGVTIHRFFGGDASVTALNARVTMEGVAFAQENSMMGKAKVFLRDAKASIPCI